MKDHIPKTDLDLLKIVLTEVHGIVQNIRAHTEEVSMENQNIDKRITDMEIELKELTNRIEVLVEKMPLKAIARLTAMVLTIQKLGKIPENYNEDSIDQVPTTAKSPR